MTSLREPAVCALSDVLIARMEHALPDTSIRQRMVDQLIEYCNEGIDDAEVFRSYFQDLLSSELDEDEYSQVIQAREILHTLETEEAPSDVLTFATD